jgi:hypothetical protein
MGTQRPAGLKRQWIFLMGAIIARFLKSVLLLETGRTLTITSQIIMTLHSALPPTGLLLLKSGSIPRGSSSSSTTISLQMNASERTTFFVLGSYLVQKSHKMRTPSSIRSCMNCSSLWSACLHMMPSREAFSPSTPTSLLALATFPLFPCSSTWKDTMACVPIECVASSVFAPRTCKTRCSTCRCPATIILRQLMLSSIVQRTYHCACTMTLWRRPKQWSPRPHKYGKKSLQRRMALRGPLFSVLSGPWSFPSHFRTTSCIWSGKISSRTSSASGPAATKEWMTVSHTSWVQIFGRLLVLHPRQLQEWYLHRLGHPFPTQQQIVLLSRLRRGPCGLCLSPPLSFKVAFPKIAITIISAPLLESSISVCNLRSVRRTLTKSSWESVNGW